MRKKGRDTLIPVDPKTIPDASEQHINCLLNMGYMPYQAEDGSIRWLTEGQYAYSQVKHAKKPLFKTMFKPKYQGMRRRQRPRLLTFIKHNAEMILLGLGVIAFIIILKYLTLVLN